MGRQRKFDAPHLRNPRNLRLENFVEKTENYGFVLQESFAKVISCAFCASCFPFSILVGQNSAGEKGDHS
jgi:hypothetical protein